MKKILDAILSLIIKPRPTGTEAPLAEAPKQDPYYRWVRGENPSLSSFFQGKEFTCNCQSTECIDQLISRELIDRLTNVRYEFNSPLFITSGYRCAAYQEILRKRGLETAIGVSQHQLGNAADLVITDPGRMLSLKVLLEAKFLAVGRLGPSFMWIHEKIKSGDGNTMPNTIDDLIASIAELQNQKNNSYDTRNREAIQKQIDILRTQLNLIKGAAKYANKNNMPRKKKTFKEGYIHRIYVMFFKKLVLNYKREDTSVISFLEMLFDVDNVSINKYKVKKKFVMPGLLYTAGSNKIQGLGQRNVKEESILFVRENKRTSSADVEYAGGVGAKEQVFFLEHTQWNSIAPLLEKLD